MTETQLEEEALEASLMKRMCHGSKPSCSPNIDVGFLSLALNLLLMSWCVHPCK